MSNKGTSSRSSKYILKEIEEPIETYIIVPTDGGWGWFVVLGSFFCNFVTDAVVYTFGMFLIEISTSLKVPQTQIALAGSMLTGCSFMIGPFVGALCNRYGFRVIACVGGIMASCSFIISSMCTSAIPFILSHGILGGVGFGMVYVPTIVIIGFYFEKWRALATAIAVTGSSFGMFLLPWVVQIYLKDYDWRLKFKILSGVTLLCVFCPLLYRNVEPVRLTGDGKNMNFSVQNVKASMVTFYIDKEDEKMCKYCRNICSRHHNAVYPTTTDVHGTIGTADKNRLNIGSETPSGQSTISKPRRSFLSIVSITDTEFRQPKRKCLRCLKNWFCCCAISTDASVARPLYRDDVFFNGSLVQLPEYQSMMQTSVAYLTENTTVDYHMSVTRVATQRDIEEGTCVICTTSVKRILATMLDFSILKSPSFLLLSFSGFFTALGMYTPYLFIADRALRHGIDYDSAYFLLSTLGISNGVGRLLSGILSSLPNVNALLITNISLFFAAITTIASAFLQGISWQYWYAGLYGMSVACVSSIRVVIIVELLGLERLTNAFGISMLFQGTACVIGLPLAGAFKDVTGGYHLPFHFAGGAIFLSAILLVPIKAVANWERKKQEELLHSY